MSRRNPTSVRLWLVAAFFTVSTLLLPCNAQCVAVDQQVLHADTPALAANQYAGAPATEAFVPAHLRHVARALLRTLDLAVLPPSASIASPNFSGDEISRENVVALGAASRAATPSRAPPAA